MVRLPNLAAVPGGAPAAFVHIHCAFDAVDLLLVIGDPLLLLLGC